MATYHDLLNMQEKFQEKYFPVENIPVNNIIIAALQELAELVESIPEYKWWTNKPKDFNNAKIEFVDILHFINLYLLKNKESITNFVNTFEKTFNRSGVENSDNSFTNLTLECYKTISNLNNTDISELAINLAILGRKLFESLDELYDMYLRKLMLNEKRQQKGYKENFQVKYLEDGQEDNKLLFSK